MDNKVHELEIALNWLLQNYKSTLANRPVRDADESIIHAELLLKEFNNENSYYVGRNI